MGMICVFCSIILHVRKNPPTTFSKICCEYGQKSSSTPIVHVFFFDNIGSWNHGTCLLCARGNFYNFTQLFFLVNLFTRQMWERARVRSVRQWSVKGLKWFFTKVQPTKHKPENACSFSRYFERMGFSLLWSITLGSCEPQTVYHHH